MEIHIKTDIQDAFKKNDFEYVLDDEAEEKNISALFFKASSTDTIYIEIEDYRIRIANHSKKKPSLNNGVEFYSIEQFKEEFDILLDSLEEYGLTKSYEVACKVLDDYIEENSKNWKEQEKIENEIENKYSITEDEQNRVYQFKKDLEEFISLPDENDDEEDIENFKEEFEESEILQEFKEYLDKNSLDWDGFEYVSFLIIKYDLEEIITHDCEINDTIEYICSDYDVSKYDVENCLDYYFCQNTEQFIVDLKNTHLNIEKLANCGIERQVRRYR